MQEWKRGEWKRGHSTFHNKLECPLFLFQEAASRAYEVDGLKIEKIGPDNSIPVLVRVFDKGLVTHVLPVEGKPCEYTFQFSQWEPEPVAGKNADITTPFFAIVKAGEDISHKRDQDYYHSAVAALRGIGGQAILAAKQFVGAQ
jgi:hypothetical protein